MLTSRAWWFLGILTVMLAVGLLAYQPVVTLVALGLLAWFGWEGLVFTFRARWVVRGLAVRRQVLDQRGPVTSLWAGRPFEVRLVLWLPQGGTLPYLAAEDPLPFGVDLAGGEPTADGALGPGRELTVAYTVRPLHPGRVRFEGARVQLADLHGLFYHVAFARAEATVRVLPPLVDARGHTATAKRHNLLPPPGINRLPRPGTGSELLDLRDYLPGDPPKTIAWKVSARRDRLITKEYESEVPVRCTLFVDTANSVRLGPPGRNALARLVEISSAVAQANMAVRDLTGLCLFDEQGATVTRPARARRHLVGVFNQLADAAGLAPATGSVNVEGLLPLAYSFAQEVYPEQMEQAVNRVPWWLPFFVPVPGPWVTPPSTAGRAYRWLTMPAAALFYLIIGLAVLTGLEEGYEAIPGDWRELLPSFDVFFAGWLVLLCLFFPFWMGLVRDALPLLLSPKRRRRTRYRKKLAAVFAHRYDLGPGGLELLLQDDGQFATHLERFLNEHHVPHTPRLYDRHGRYLYASPEKVDVLASALLRSVGKGHDNELFVLLVDLVELEGRLDPLVRAVKVALARHHQVMVICPWPPELGPPAAAPPDEDFDLLEAALPRRGGSLAALSPAGMKEFLKGLTARRYERAFHRLRRTFARVQVPVLCAASDDPVQLVLDRLDRMRGMRRRR